MTIPDFFSLVEDVDEKEEAPDFFSLVEDVDEKEEAPDFFSLVEKDYDKTSEHPTESKKLPEEKSEEPKIPDFVGAVEPPTFLDKALSFLPAKVKDPVLTGIKKSASSILAGQGMTLEEIVAREQQDPAFFSDLFEEAVSIFTDIPFFAVAAIPGGIVGGEGGALMGGAIGGPPGAIIGGAIGTATGGGASAFGARTLVQEIYREYLEHKATGSDLTWAEFVERSDKVSGKALKSMLIGGITGGAGGNVARGGAGALEKFVAENVAFATAETAVSGEVPTVKGLISNALLIGGLHASSKIVEGIAQKALDSGRNPVDVTNEYSKNIEKGLSPEKAIDKISIVQEVEKELVKEKSSVAKKLVEEKAAKEEKAVQEIDKERDVKVEESKEEIRKTLRQDEKVYEKEDTQTKESSEKLNKDIDASEKKYVEDVEKANTKIEEKLSREVDKADKSTVKIEREAEKEASKIDDTSEKQKLRVEKVEAEKLKQQEKLIDSQEKSKLKLEETKRNQEKKASDKRFENTTAPKAREKLAETRRNQKKRYNDKVKRIEKEAEDSRQAAREAKEERAEAKQDKIDEQANNKIKRIEKDSKKKIKQLNDKAIENADKIRQQELSRVEQESRKREDDILKRAEARDKKLEKGKQKTFEEYKASLQKSNAKIQKAHDIAAEKKSKQSSKLKQDILKKWSKEKGRIETESRPRVEEAVARRKTVEEQVSIGETQKVTHKEKESLRSQIIDEFYPLEKLVKDLNAEDLPISQNPYKLARLSRGWSGKAETFLTYKTFDPITLKFKNKGLKDILRPIRNDTAEFSRYLAAEHAIELNKFGKETGIKLEDAQRIISEDKGKFAKAKHELDVFRNDILDYAEGAGLLSPELRTKFEEMYKNYVPFNRVIEQGEAFVGRNLKPKSPFYRLDGSFRPIIDPLESLIKNTYSIIRASEQNMVTRSLVDLVEAKKGVGKALEFKAEKPVIETARNVLDIMELGKSEKGKITYFDNGVKRTYEVPKEVAEAIQGMTQQQFGLMSKILSYPTRAIRLTAVQLNPTFILKNILRDQTEALLYSKYGYIPFFDMAKGLFHSMGKTELYYKWKAAGGDQAFVSSLSRDVNQKKLRNLTKNKALNIATSFEGLAQGIESIPEAIEKSTRLGEFRKGLSRTGMNANELREAAFNSREITLDFAKRGAKTQLANNAIPFFNAHIQGIDKFYRELKNNPSKMIKAAPAVAVKAATYLTLPSLALWYANKDDERYQELPDWEKNTYWHIFLPDYMPKIIQHWRIPKPFEIGAAFATIPERVAQYIYEKDPDELEQAFRALYDVGAPQYIPAIAQPPLESYSNKRLYFGTPLIPQNQIGLPAEMQRTAYTTETAKLIGKGISKIPFIGDTQIASPIEIDHWLTAWTGEPGRWLLSASDTILEKAAIVPEVIRPEKELADYPVLKAILGRETSGTQSKSIRKFYDVSEDINKHFKGKTELRKRGEAYGKEKYSIYEKNKSNRIRKVFAKNFKLINNIRMDPLITASEKKIQINQLAADMTGVAREFLSELREDKE